MSGEEVRRIRHAVVTILLICACLCLNGCFTVPLDPHYEGPPVRPASLDEQYPNNQPYTAASNVVTGEKELFVIRRITLTSDYDPIIIDYYQRPEKSDRLILVFPVLGGKNTIAAYFARYFARRGFDTAIVNRNDSFKKPENYDRFEEILRKDLIRDRIALDFFEREYGKKEFGSFGISRGGINVAVTAGVDSRLKHNVIAMGGTDLIGMFKETHQGRMREYRAKVMASKGITEDEFYQRLRDMLKTDPKNVSKYIDARDTLMMLALYDKTVPIKYGEQLRKEIGNPETIYLVADHFTALLYTQFLKFLPPTREFSILPIDYVETEALNFYHRSFHTGVRNVKPVWMRVLQVPMNIVGRLVHWIF